LKYLYATPLNCWVHLSLPSSLPQGYDITLFNRGKTANRAVPDESPAAFEERVKKTKLLNKI